MLLSFAQFEREVTGERIRDEKLATAKKGLWGSGVCSYGYKLVDKKLIPDDLESMNVRKIFEWYLELKSVSELRYKLIDEGIFTRNKKHFTSGNLYELLKRHLYIGKVVHKKQVYDGIHEPIVDPEIFSQVQKLLKENNKSNKQKVLAKEPSLLASKLYDDSGNIMSPSHSNKKGKRYRYYVSQAIISKQKEKQGSLPPIPAHELEQASSDFIKQRLEDLLTFENYSIEQYQLYQSNLDHYLDNWSLQNKETYFIIRQIIHKIVISHIKIIYYLNPNSLQELFELIITKQDINNCENKEITDNDCEIIILSCELKRMNQGKTLIIGSSQNNMKNKGIIELLKKSWEWSDNIEKGMSIKEIAEKEKISVGYVGKVLKLRFLSPRIQKMILTGEQPPEWTVHKLRQCKKNRRTY